MLTARVTRSIISSTALYSCAVSLALGLSACSSDRERPGGTRPDAGGPDAGPVVDTGTPPADAGPPLTDGGPPPQPDGGPPPTDGGPPSPADAGPIDTGPATPSGPLTRVQDHGIPGVYYGGLAVADFDGDGKPDVVLGGAWNKAFARPNQSLFAYNDEVRVYKNVSTGPGDIKFELGFQPSISGGGGVLVRVGDFNGDQLPDFAVQFRDGDSPGSDTAAFMNQGGMQFTKTILQSGFDTQNNSLGMDAADMDQDGRDDLVFINTGYGSGPGLWYTYKNNRWQAQQSNFAHEITYGGTLTAGDLTGDGYPEVAVGGNGSQPFGSYNCSDTVLYGQVHKNRGSANPGLESAAWAVVTDYALSVNRNNPPRCEGMDNAGMLIADLDMDGNNDLLLAGSATSFQGPPTSDWTHYDFAVLYNRDGTGHNFVTWENGGPPFAPALGVTNGGAGNVDFPNLAVGDVTGDGLPEVLMQGHHKDYSDGVGGAYDFETTLYENRGDHMVKMPLAMPQLAECGGAFADFDGDGLNDFIYCGASRPFHSNGSNGSDFNDASTIFTVIYRNQ